MTSFIAKHTIGHFTKKASSAVNNTFNSNKDAVVDETNAGGIDWTARNWPKYLNILHFDLDNDPIPDTCKLIVKRLYWTIQYVQCILVLNLFTNIALVGSHVDPSADHILFSVLHILIGTPLIQYSWYLGYKSLAIEVVLRQKQIWKVLWGCICVVIVLLFSIGSGNVHGWSGIKGSTNGGWIAVSVIESLCWMAALGLALWSAWLYHQYRGHSHQPKLHKHETKTATSRNSTSAATPANAPQQQPEVQTNKYSLEAERGRADRTVTKADRQRWQNMATKV